MDAANRTALEVGARRFHVELDGPAVDRFARYLELLVAWNRRIKLTTVVEPSAVVERHFLDSLAVAPELVGATSLVDVGSGPGFPGIPCAIVRPDLRVTVVESIQKKATFLEALKRELGLGNVTVSATRMEALVERGLRFDVAVSRATFSPREWIERAAELVRPGGKVIAMVVPEEGAAADVGSDAAEKVAPDWARSYTSIRQGETYAAGRALIVLATKGQVP